MDYRRGADTVVELNRTFNAVFAAGNTFNRITGLAKILRRVPEAGPWSMIHS